MIEKQQQLTFNKGITNVPSDAICSDGELSDCVGFTSENGELKPIQNPKHITLASDGIPAAKVLVVHDGRYIYESTSGGHNLLYYNRTTGTYPTVMPISGTLKDVTTIGNTVIASTDTEIHYALWTGSNYIDLENKIPEPDVSLYLGDPLQIRSHGVKFSEFVNDGAVIEEMQTAYNDAVIGLYEKCKNEVHANKLFAEPFVAVVAVELYDGSYIMHGPPQIMLPWYNPIVSVASEHGFHDTTPDLYMMGYSIYATADYDYSKWSDIVKNVSLFVSREVSLINRNLDAIWEQVDKSITNFGYHLVNRQIDIQGRWVDDSGYAVILNSKVLQNRSNSDVKKELEETSIFFKLCDLGTIRSGSQNTKDLYTSDIIVNLEVQQPLPNDDFHSHDDYMGSRLYSYNGRLHISGIKRYLFGGFKHFFPWNRPSGDTIEYHIEVTLSINGIDKTVSQSVTTREAIGESYFYYPDPRAKEVKIYNGNLQHLLYTRTLTEHPGLNGAYWFGGFPTYSASDNGYAPYVSPSSGPWNDNYGTNEELLDTIMVSEVDNPFLFLSKGYVKINAPVVGMAAVTMALSEYQHGHQPLIVFTEKGIWSLSLNNEGYYVATQSESREICNNASSITQIDHGVFFASEKGLMLTTTSGTKCVSQQMRGTDFDKFIDSCFMAYDYRDSLLHIYKTTGDTYHYVYNMKTGTFSTMSDTPRILSAVSNYPDTIIQAGLSDSFAAYSFIQKPDEQDDPGASATGTYTATLVTRPMKLENALALKSIMEVRHIMDMEGSVSLKIYASNNLKHAANTWVQLTSLRGTPWKYYKFEYTFTGLKATDRYAGTLVVTQERRLDKLR